MQIYLIDQQQVVTGAGLWLEEVLQSQNGEL